MSGPDPEVSPADAQEQATPVEPDSPLAWDDIDRELHDRPGEATEADVVDQLRPPDAHSAPVAMPGRLADLVTDDEVPEADALEQSRVVIDDDDEWPR